MTFAVALALALGCGGPPGAERPSAPSCRGATVDDPDQLEALATCQVIEGDLAIRGASVIDLEALAAVREIRGDLVVGPTSRLASVRGLARLATIGGDLIVARNFELGGVWLESLATVGGAVRVERNLALITASLHRLADVGGALSIEGNGNLERVDLSALRRVAGDLVVRGRTEVALALPDSVTVRGERHIDLGQARHSP